eukprot:861858-Amphidinium_carterae.1
MIAMCWLSIAENQFSGSLPEGGIAGMKSLGRLYIQENRLANTLPGTGMIGLTALEILSSERNKLAGRGHGDFQVVTKIGNHVKMVHCCTEMAKHLRIEPKSSGALLDSIFLLKVIYGVILRKILELIELQFRGLGGPLPEEGCARMTTLISLIMHENLLSNTLPTDGLCSMTALEWLSLNKNHMTGFETRRANTSRLGHLARGTTFSFQGRPL